ncbi:hypothetical protein TorRG33x02_111900 [Trema orientale]|uniref:Uncharacterized protein n=1 Tax=Trema orientale TaxID=63057 RepID=A0A2P5F547_TREOI|nr:hypothetical protein TorRG33x02_111900 [Trema orientale]
MFSKVILAQVSPLHVISLNKMSRVYGPKSMRLRFEQWGNYARQVQVALLIKVTQHRRSGQFSSKLTGHL